MQNITKCFTPKKKFTEKPTESDVINILMVDDLQENLTALEAVLSSSHYHLVSARSGEEALRYILKQDFAVILLDVQMPGLNGFETAKLIKARKKSKNIPIIFITAISQDMEHVIHGYSVGAIDYIFKPFHPETLKRKVEQFVNIHQGHTELIKQTEWKQTLELNEVHQQLNQTTVNLHEKEILANVIGRTLQDTIVTFDEEGFILSINPIVKEMFGFHENELLGKHLTTILPAVNLTGELFVGLSIDSISKVSKLVEAVALRKDKIRFPAEIQIGDAVIDDHRIFVCTIRDISERKEIELVKNQQYNLLKKEVEDRTLDLLLANQKLQQEIEERKKVADDLYVSNEQFRKIFEASPSLMVIRSIKDGRFIDVNKTWLNYTGYEYDKVKDQIFDWTINKNFDGKEVAFPNPEWKEPVSNIKVTYQAKNGEMRSGLLSTEIIEIQNKACVLIVLNDITETVRLEKEMSRLDRLNLIGEMAAGIAHEIRNPMTTVHGFLQMAKINNQPLTDKYIDLMLDELDRANNIIKEFLTLAKNKASDKRKKCLNQIIESILPLVNAEAILAGKRVQHQLSKCPLIDIDEKEIRQLFLNLALNGLEAMDPGGTLTVKTYSNEKEVVLEIHDSGKGINKEILDKIGTPFFTTKENGTGLGLAVCYSIADRHNAAIKVQTSKKGTCFAICFRR
ncbi:response regulator [Bacillus sp. EB600]|uniref:response regulator n=1 Tax=Bacillus sp. EB600 TaxID=2806345 RepID=UPI002108BCB8|nr:response regulator [Bacillus sp. EB600]MCQ6280388.1 response regulator [Bacillus sp. EB600]